MNPPKLSQRQIKKAFRFLIDSELNTNEIVDILKLKCHPRTLRASFERYLKDKPVLRKKYKDRNLKIRLIRSTRSCQTRSFRSKMSKERSNFIKNNPNASYTFAIGNWLEKTKKRPRLFCDSLLEAKFCHHFEKDKQVKKYERCSFQIPYFWNGCTRNYLPDFTVITQSGNKYVVEVKPRFRMKDPQVRAKTRAAQQHLKDTHRFFIEENPNRLKLI